MISILLREISSFSIFRPQKLANRITNAVLAIISCAILIVIECFIYCRVYDKFAAYKGVDSSLTAIVLFAFFLVSIVATLPKASSVFFDRRERLILAPLPVSVNDIFASKSLYLLIRFVAFHMATSFPILVCFGIKYHGLFVYYMLDFLYVVAISAMSLGAVFLLCFPFYFLDSWIRRNVWMLLFASFAFMVGLTFLYSYLLNLFVALVSGNSIDSLLSRSGVEFLVAVSDSLYPFKTIVMTAGAGADWRLMLVLLLVPLTVLACAFPVVYFAFSAFMKSGRAKCRRRRAYFHGLKNPIQALIGKEFRVLASSSDGVFSFFPLILSSPLLLVSVVVAVEAIFHLGNLNYVSSLYPGFFFFIKVVLVFLFLSVLNGSGGLSLKKEGEASKLMKQFPISGRMQLLIKIAVPLSCSSISFLVSMGALAWLGKISLPEMGYLMAAGMLYLGSLYLGYVLTELKSSNSSGPVMAAVSFIAPFAFALAPSLLSIIGYSYSELPYAVLLALSAALFLPFAIVFLIRGERLFVCYEGARS